LTFKRSGSGYRIPPGRQSVRAWRTVREEPDSPSVLRVHREFLHVFHSIHFVGGFLVHEVRGRFVLECQTVRGSIADSPLLRMQYWWFRTYFRAVRHSPADNPPRPHGQSARCLRMVRQVLRRVAKSFAP
jgi:hypothetical protein